MNLGSTTTTAVTSSANPSSFGQSVTLTATVTPTSTNVPTGTVTFKDGTVSIGTALLKQGTTDVATLTQAFTALSIHTITALYGGDNNSLASTSTPVLQTVNRASVTIALNSSNNPSTFGQSVTFTATVTAVTGAFDNGGTVQFSVDGSTFGARPL